MNNDDLAAAFRDLQAELDRRGISTVLAGGLAVHELVDLDPSGARRFDPRSLEPASLARIGRTTDDVDFIVPAEAKADAASRLSDLDFRRDPKLDFRYHRADVVVDLLSTASTTPPLSEILSIIESRVRQNPGPPPHLATPAELVVLKLIAWDDRHADRDLLDLARLALWDLDGRGVAEGLRLLLHGLSNMTLAACRRTAGAFADRDATGPRAYWVEFLQQVVVTDPDALEDRVRSMVSGAARRLLRDV